MSNQISTFNFKSNPVRVEIFEQQPHFCLLDVCSVFEIQNSRRVQSEMLDPQGVRQAYILAKDEKQRKTSFINEPNLYRIIFRSEKPIAKEFQNWVFEEVLPQIRKTGQYSAQQQLALQQTTPDDRKGLRDAITTLVNKKGLIYSEVYSLVHQQFNVSHINELTQTQISQAVQYIHFLTLNLEAIFQKGEEINILAYTFDAIMKHARLAQELAEKVINYQEKQFALLGIERHCRHNELTASANSLLHEFKYFLREGETLLAKHAENPQLTRQVKSSKRDF